MAWKPDSNKPMDLGEIPHKKQISEEELANMRVNAPDRDMHEAHEKQAKLEEQILTDIVDQGEKYEEAVAFIGGFLVGHDQYAGPGILLDDFIVDLSNELQKTPEVK